MWWSQLTSGPRQMLVLALAGCVIANICCNTLRISADDAGDGTGSVSAFSFVAPPEGNSRDAASEDSTIHFTEEEALQLNEEVANFTTDEVLLWAVRKFPHRLVQFSSFGFSGLVILDKLANLGVLEQVPFVTIDTLHLFDETYELVETVSARYPAMRLRTYYPEGYAAGEQLEFDSMHGDDMWAHQFSQYTYLTKVEPTMRALRDLDPHAWITGRRRSQGDARVALPIVEYDEGRLKINPLAGWTSTEVRSYIEESAVPYNPLHDQGYTSIGDKMNTRPTEQGEGERAGRFLSTGQGTTECGMHERKVKLSSL